MLRYCSNCKINVRDARVMAHPKACNFCIFSEGTFTNNTEWNCNWVCTGGMTDPGDVMLDNPNCLRLQIEHDDKAYYCGSNGKSWCGPDHIRYSFYTTVRLPGKPSKIYEYYQLGETQHCCNSAHPMNKECMRTLPKFKVEIKKPFVGIYPEMFIIDKFFYIVDESDANKVQDEVYGIISGMFSNLKIDIRNIVDISVFYTNHYVESREKWIVYLIYRLPVATPEVMFKFHMEHSRIADQLLSDIRSKAYNENAFLNYMTNLRNQVETALSQLNKAKVVGGGLQTVAMAFQFGAQALQASAGNPWIALGGAAVGAMIGLAATALGAIDNKDIESIKKYVAVIGKRKPGWTLTLIKGLPDGIFLLEIKKGAIKYRNGIAEIDQIVALHSLSDERGSRQKVGANGVLFNEKVVNMIYRSLNGKEVDLYKTSDGRYAFITDTTVNFTRDYYQYEGQVVYGGSNNRSIRVKSEQDAVKFIVVSANDRLQIYKYDKDMMNALKSKVFKSMNKAGKAKIVYKGRK